MFGFEQYDSTFKVHLRAARAFLGLPKNVASFGLVSELNWLMPHLQSRLKMIQHFGRIMRTPRHRLMYRVFMRDRKLNETQQVNTWCSEIKSILYDNSLNQVYDIANFCSKKCDNYNKKVSSSNKRHLRILNYNKLTVKF